MTEAATCRSALVVLSPPKLLKPILRLVVRLPAPVQKGHGCDAKAAADTCADDETQEVKHLPAPWLPTSSQYRNPLD